MVQRDKRRFTPYDANGLQGGETGMSEPERTEVAAAEGEAETFVITDADIDEAITACDGDMRATIKGAADRPAIPGGRARDGAAGSKLGLCQGKAKPEAAEGDGELGHGDCHQLAKLPDFYKYFFDTLID